MTLAAAAIFLALGAVPVYAFGLWAFPFGKCIWCRGDGIRGGTYCRRCDGSGRRVRFGRRTFDRIRAEYRRGTDRPADHHRRDFR